VRTGKIGDDEHGRKNLQVLAPHENIQYSTSTSMFPPLA